MWLPAPAAVRMTEAQIDPRSRKERAWSEVNAVDVALDRGEITEDEWHAAMAKLVASAYLSESNPYAQAGHHGDATSWEASRGFIAEALDRSGTFLDVGCASGVMMESVVRWAAAKNLDVEPYGLEVVPELADLARARLPRWKDRIYVGNIRSGPLQAIGLTSYFFNLNTRRGPDAPRC